MVTGITLQQNKLPDFDFKLPLPQLMEDNLWFSFDYAKFDTILMLTVRVRYTAKDIYQDLTCGTASWFGMYKTETDGNLITSPELYPACQHATNLANMPLSLLARSGKIPQKNIVCPPLSHCEEGLDVVSNWWNSQL